jgi:hypothetical protein
MIHFRGVEKPIGKQRVGVTLSNNLGVPVPAP